MLIRKNDISKIVKEKHFGEGVERLDHLYILQNTQEDSHST